MRALGNGLLVSYLIDEGDRFVYVNKGDLVEARLNESELHLLAVENLTELARSSLEVEEAGGIYAALLGGYFEASLILIPEFWTIEVAELLPHGCVAALPACDVLAFCDSESAAGIAELRAVISRVYRAGDLSEHSFGEKLTAHGAYSKTRSRDGFPQFCHEL